MPMYNPSSTSCNISSILPSNECTTPSPKRDRLARIISTNVPSVFLLWRNNGSLVFSASSNCLSKYLICPAAAFAAGIVVQREHWWDHFRCLWSEPPESHDHRTEVCQSPDQIHQLQQPWLCCRLPAEE